MDQSGKHQLAIGPAGEVYREAGREAERKHQMLVAALKDELCKFKRPEGVMMESSSWMVTAQNSKLTAIAATAARWDERVEPKHAFLKTCVFDDTRERVLIGAQG